MNSSNRHLAKAGIAASVALRFKDAVSILKQKLPAVIALLTLCAVSLNPLPSIAAEKDGAKKTTTVKLKESGTSITTATEFHLTATVSPSKAKGTVTFSCIHIATGNRIWIPFAQVPVIAGEANKSTLIGFPGHYEFKAEYDGSTTYATNESNTVSVYVKNSKSFVEPTASPSPSGEKLSTCWP
jgi:hypothetical protein